MFSNGTEYMLFLGDNCFKCPKFVEFPNDENDMCPIDRRINRCQFMDYEDAKKEFPYEWLDEGGYIYTQKIQGVDRE